MIGPGIKFAAIILLLFAGFHIIAHKEVSTLTKREKKVAKLKDYSCLLLKKRLDRTNSKQVFKAFKMKCSGS